MPVEEKRRERAKKFAKALLHKLLEERQIQLTERSNSNIFLIMVDAFMDFYANEEL